MGRNGTSSVAEMGDTPPLAWAESRQKRGRNVAEIWQKCRRHVAHAARPAARRRPVAGAPPSAPAPVHTSPRRAVHRIPPQRPCPAPREHSSRAPRSTPHALRMTDNVSCPSGASRMLSMLRPCYAHATPMPRPCHAHTMPMPCPYHAHATRPLLLLLLLLLLHRSSVSTTRLQPSVGSGTVPPPHASLQGARSPALAAYRARSPARRFPPSPPSPSSSALASAASRVASGGGIVISAGIGRTAHTHVGAAGTEISAGHGRHRRPDSASR